MSNESTSISLTLRGNIYDVAYTMETAEQDTKKYTFVLTGDVYNALENEAYFKTKNRYTVEGFRKGKAPLHTIKKWYGDLTFLESMVDIAVNECYHAFYQSVCANLKMGANPDLEYGKIDGEQIAFTFVIVEYPTLTDVKYKGLDVAKVEAKEVTDEMVNERLDAARAKAGYWKDVTDRACAMGDTTVIDYSGSVDGVKFDGGTAEAQELELGSGHFIPGFEEQVVGMSIGDERDITVTFPTEYGAEDLAGKEAVFHIVLHGIKVKELPVADDEFAKDVSEFDTLDELKASYKKEIADEEAKKAKDGTEQNLLKAVLDANPVTINPAIILEAAERKVGEFEEMLKRSGMSFDMYASYTGVTREKMVEDYKTSCAETELRSLVLSEVVRLEGLTITPEEMEAKIAEDAEKAGKSVDDYKKEMKREEFDYMFNSMLSDKLIDFLLANNNLINA